MKACSLSRVVFRNQFISRPIPLSERLSRNRDSPFWVFETGGRLPHPRTSGVSCPGVFRAHQPTETSMDYSRYFGAFLSPFRLRRRVGLRNESGRCDGRSGKGGPLLLSLSRGRQGVHLPLHFVILPPHPTVCDGCNGHVLGFAANQHSMSHVCPTTFDSRNETMGQFDQDDT
jgi:hypothetical protein